MEEEVARIAEDLEQFPIVVVGMPGHGKSTTIKTILAKVRELKPGYVIRVFDCSQSWYHQAPIKYRVHITEEDLEYPPILSDVVYEMGKLSQEQRREFVAKIIEQDYQERYDAQLEGRMNTHPRSLYIFEEAGTYFDSISFNKKGKIYDTLRDFIMIGRNYGISSILITQVESGELATKVRKRSAHLIGRVTGYAEINALTRVTDPETVEIAKELPRFHWIYYSAGAGEPFRVRDEVRQVPEDFDVPRVEVPIQEIKQEDNWSKALKWFMVFFIILGGLVILFAW